VKKFEALEEFQAEKEAEAEENGDDEEFTSSKKKKKKMEEEKPLSEEDLEEIFKRTSTFTAKSLVLPPDPRQVIMIPGEYDSDPEYFVFDDGWDMTGLVQEEDENGGLVYYSDNESQFSDEDDEEWGDLRKRGHGRSRKRRAAAARAAKAVKPAKAPKEKKPKAESSKDDLMLPGPSKARLSLLNRVRRRKLADPNALQIIRIPNDPIPSNWSKRITQYIPPTCKHVHTPWTSDDVLMPRPVKYSAETAPWSQRVPLSSDLPSIKDKLLELAKQSEGFHAIVMSPPWKEPRPGATPIEGGIVPEDLLKLPLGDHSFLSAGFVYIWTPKHWLHRTLQALEQMDLHYVENAVVVNERVGDGPPLSQPCTYFSQQKETLLVCRRGVKQESTGKINWAPVELRHQRISDVHLACYRPSATRADIPKKPVNYVHKMTETMLPFSRYNADLEDNKPRFCELWADKDVTRPGWVMVSIV